jgi:hypothetical protein
MRRSLQGSSVALALVLAASPAAGGQEPQSRHLWATINVCDTIRYPDQIGIRASMPGAADPTEQMFMRFRVQYFRVGDQKWHNIPKGGDSGFKPVGPAKYKARQAGLVFRFAPPAGGSYRMRGRVSFQWRTKKGKVVHREAQLTTAGHRSTAGSDPEGYSSDECVIS